MRQVLGGAGMLTEWGQGCQFSSSGGDSTGECDPIMDLADSRLSSWIDWYWSGPLMDGTKLCLNSTAVAFPNSLFCLLFFFIIRMAAIGRGDRHLLPQLRALRGRHALADAL
jgi:hypothetical protein